MCNFVTKATACSDVWSCPCQAGNQRATSRNSRCASHDLMLLTLPHLQLLQRGCSACSFSLLPFLIFLRTHTSGSTSGSSARVLEGTPGLCHSLQCFQQSLRGWRSWYFASSSCNSSKSPGTEVTYSSPKTDKCNRVQLSTSTRIYIQEG